MAPRITPAPMSRAFQAQEPRAVSTANLTTGMFMADAVEDVVRIRELYAAGYSQGRLAADFRIAPGHVSEIVTRKLWSHLPPTSGERNATRDRRIDKPKLSDRDIAEIKAAHALGGKTYKDLAERYGVSKRLIGRAVRGRLKTTGSRSS